MAQMIADRYRVIRVMPEINGIAYSCVSDGETGQICILSAVSEQDQIRRCLEELAALPEEKGYQGSFLRDHTLYVKTAWMQGKTLRSALSEKRMGYRERLLLIRHIFTESLTFDFLPDVLRDSLFDPDYILTEGDSLFFQLRIRIADQASICRGINRGGVPFGARELLMEVFSAEEQARHKGLYLALEKLKREVTASSGELLHDVDQMLAEEDRRTDRLFGLKKKGKRCAAVLGKAAVCAAAAGLVISLISCGGEKKEPAVYQDITAIGSVQISSDGGEP